MSRRDPIIQDVFEIRSRPYKVALYNHQLTWCPRQAGGEDLSELISVQVWDILNAKIQHKGGDANQNMVSTGCCPTACSEPMWESLVIDFAQRKKDTKKKKDIWKLKQLILTHSEREVLSNWCIVIQARIGAIVSRPKNILFFVNPFGGKRKGANIFEKKIKKILEMCKVKWTVINTQYQNHAATELMYMSEEKLKEYDVVVAVGGDGTVCEVVTGLLMRGLITSEFPETYELTPSPVPIAVIPAGSSNALAYSLHGNGDSVTASIHLVLGGSVPLDVAALRNSTGVCKFIVGQMSYGHLADTLVHSEKLRWMGPKRYDYAGLRKFLGHATYQGSIDMKVCVDDFQNPPSICSGGNGCNDCMSSTRSVKNSCEWRRVEGNFIGISGANISCRCALCPLGMAPFAHLSDGFIDLILIKKASRLGHLRYLLRIASDSPRAFSLPFVERYRVEEFVFTPIQCCEPPSAQSIISQGPFMESGSSTSMVACGCDARKQEKRHSVWNCDGELFLQPSVRVTVHKNLIRIMSRRRPDIQEGNQNQQCR